MELSKEAAQSDPASPHIAESSVDPALLIRKRQTRFWSSPWVLIAIVVIAVGLSVVVRPKAIAAFVERLGTSTGGWTKAGLQIHSQALLPLGLIVIALGSVLLLWLVPRWQTASLHALTPEARFDKINESRKTLAQIIGGLFVIATLFSTARTLQISQQQEATAAEQTQIAREAQITDRFTRAVDQLGNKERLELRVGGIYALERLAKESREDHWPIVEVLTTYVRENARRQQIPKNASNQDHRTVRADIQAILTVLGRRDSTFETRVVSGGGKARERINLMDVDLRGVNLFDANLSNANLTAADLTGANLFYAQLTGADLRGASLSDANLFRAYLTGADLSTAHNVSQDQIDGAMGDFQTKLPPGIARPARWLK